MIKIKREIKNITKNNSNNTMKVKELKKENKDYAPPHQ